MRWLLLLMCACAPRTPAALSPTNPELPLEGRRLLAAAEDDVEIMRMDAATARRAVDEAEQRRKKDRKRVEALAGADTTSLSAAVDAMHDARIRHARAMESVAQSNLDLAIARRDRTMAEATIRYDLGARNLDPLDAAVEAALQKLLAARTEADEAEAVVESSTADMWSRWKAFVDAGGETLAWYTE